MPQLVHSQVAIIGGGVCGLWLLNVLTRAGYDAVLFEQDTLGGAQTLASQGMIHGGIKYALGGFTTPSSETIAGMPARWDACINGTGSLDLSNVNLLSRDYFLFSDASLSSRVTTFLGSKSLRGRVLPLKREAYPPYFTDPAFKGSVYRLADMVIDTGSLVESLAGQARGRTFRCAPTVLASVEGDVTHLLLANDLGLVADTYIFCAGAGNEALLKELSLKNVTMQRRPLKQVLVKQAGLPAVFAHAVSLKAGARPRVTITTHKAPDGDPVWYLGGDLAETGVDRSDEEQIATAKREMQTLLPWIDLDGGQWRTLTVDRAEPAQRDHGRPDSPFVRQAGNAIVCWPTKLTLTPLLADEVMTKLKAGPSTTPSSPSLHSSLEALSSIPPATPGLAPWETLFS